MSEPIGKGDWVQCVDAWSPNGALADGGFLVEGRVYCVEAVTVAMANFELVPAVRLVGQPDRHSRSGRKGSYAVSRFRPIYRRRDAEALTAKLLVAAPSGVAPASVERRSRDTIKEPVSSLSDLRSQG